MISHLLQLSPIRGANTLTLGLNAKLDLLQLSPIRGANVLIPSASMLLTSFAFILWGVGTCALWLWVAFANNIYERLLHASIHTSLWEWLSLLYFLSLYTTPHFAALFPGSLSLCTLANIRITRGRHILVYDCTCAGDKPIQHWRRMGLALETNTFSAGDEHV